MNKTILFTLIFISLILGPSFFINSGFFVFLDTVFFPIYDLSYNFNYSIYFNLHDFFSYLIWYELFSKIYLFATLSLWGYVWYKISQLVLEYFDVKDKKLSSLISILWIVFTLCNPFIYERLVTQVGIALWIFTIWLAFYHLLEYLKQEKNKYFYLSALFFSLSVSIFPHSLIFIIIIWIAFLIFFIKKIKIIPLLLSWILFTLINIHLFAWFFQLWSNQILSATEKFNYQNVEAFQQNALSGLWVDITSLLLYGFWGERGERIFLPEKVNEYWYIFGFIILIIIFYWIYISFKKSKKITWFLLTIWVFSYILALGISSNIFWFFSHFLYENIPYYIGMREPGKLLGMVAIIYTFFFLIGNIFIIQKATEWMKNQQIIFHPYLQNSYTYCALIIFIILSWSPNMLFWFNGQLKIIKYPIEYLEARNILWAENDEKNLVLPWHAYMWCAWNYGKIISNTMPAILDWKQTISAENLEMWTLYSNTKTPLTDDIENFISTQDVSYLKKNNIKNIIFQKNCWAFMRYSFLSEIPELKSIYNKPQLEIFQIQYDKK